MERLINRPVYLRRLIESKDTDLVKIVTGIRRSGKSSILEIYADWLRENGVPGGNIIIMNLESLKYRDLDNHLALYDYITKKITNTERYYLIFDELQAVSGWEKAIESFRLDYNTDIYITGSNAYMLSSEFGTLLSGRYIEIKMLPLSFREFLTFNEFPRDMPADSKFQLFLQFGGMPGLTQFRFNEARITEATEGIYSTIVLKDILQRSSLTDRNLLQKIALFLCGNIGGITSPHNIGAVLSKDGQTEKSIASKTVEKYITLLQSAYIFYHIQRYDIKGKQLLKTLGKYYIADTGFRNLLLGYRDQNRGVILENVVFLELLRRGYRVHIGKTGETEVDFIAEKPAEKLYIQVSESIISEETRQRELRSLQTIQDNHEKIILSMDRNFLRSYDGIKIINIIDFLSEDCD